MAPQRNASAASAALAEPAPMGSAVTGGDTPVIETGSTERGSGVARQGFEHLPTMPSGRILRREEADAWTDGFRFLAEARKAYDEERSRGYRDGREAGAAEAVRIIANATAKVDGYLAFLDKDMAKLALDIVRRILDEIDVASLTEKAAVRAIADFRKAKSLTITVHPDNLAQVRAAVDSHLRKANLGLTARVEADPAMATGGCLVASEFAVVDASIETQLQALAEGFGVEL